MIAQLLKEGKLSLLRASGGAGSTGEVHLVTLKRKKFVLRVCKDKASAKRQIRYYNKFKKYDFLPTLLDSSGRYLLFKYVEGRDVKYKGEDNRVIKKIGAICAIINKQKTHYDYKSNFETTHKIIVSKHILPKSKIIAILKAYAQLSSKVKLVTSLDARDVTNDNFRVSKKGKVYFVDIEAIAPNVCGLGVAKAFSFWFKNIKEQTAFKKGYIAMNSDYIFTHDYLNFVMLLFLTDRIVYKFKHGQKILVVGAAHKLLRCIRQVSRTTF